MADHTVVPRDALIFDQQRKSTSTSTCATNKATVPWLDEKDEEPPAEREEISNGCLEPSCWCLPSRA